MKDLPKDLIINWDQTSMKIVPSSSWTMEKHGTKHVEIATADDNWQITGLFTTATDQFLPIQLIYEGSTSRCLPSAVKFPKGWNITCSPNHCSNGDTMIEYINEILILFITVKRKELKRAADYQRAMYR